MLDPDKTPVDYPYKPNDFQPNFSIRDTQPAQPLTLEEQVAHLVVEVDGLKQQNEDLSTKVGLCLNYLEELAKIHGVAKS